MFTKTLYKFGNYAGTIHNPDEVLSDIKVDLKKSVPAHIGNNETRVFITFKDGTNITAYSLPIEYRKILEV